jgi:3-methylfumaryl-CoA hydratase
VHGPLIATLLLDLLRRERPGGRARDFRFKAVARPSTCIRSTSTAPPSADGKMVHLWASDHEGWLTMDATATLR